MSVSLIELIPHDMQKVYNMLSVPKQRQIVVKTLNDVGRDAFSRGKKELKRKYTIKGSMRSMPLKAKKANNYRLSYKIQASFKRLSLTKFKGTKQSKQGVVAEIRRGKKQGIDDAFISNITGRDWSKRGQRRIGRPMQDPLVFRRVREDAYPIHGLTTLSYGKMVSTKEMRLVYDKVVGRRGAIYLQRRINALIVSGKTGL